MQKFKVLSSLVHNNTEFQKGSLIELKPEEAERLLELKVIEKTKEETAESTGKPVEKFSSSVSTAEIEKAANAAVEAPRTTRRVKCMKCKEERELVDVQVSTGRESGVIHILGTCSVCGTKNSRMIGKERRKKTDG